MKELKLEDILEQPEIKCYFEDEPVRIANGSVQIYEMSNDLLFQIINAKFRSRYFRDSIPNSSWDFEYEMVFNAAVKELEKFMQGAIKEIERILTDQQIRRDLEELFPLSYFQHKSKQLKNVPYVNKIISWALSDMIVDNDDYMLAQLRKYIRIVKYSVLCYYKTKDYEEQFSKDENYEIETFAKDLRIEGFNENVSGIALCLLPFAGVVGKADEFKDKEKCFDLLDLLGDMKRLQEAIKERYSPARLDIHERGSVDYLQLVAYLGEAADGLPGMSNDGLKLLKRSLNHCPYPTKRKFLDFIKDAYELGLLAPETRSDKLELYTKFFCGEGIIREEETQDVKKDAKRVMSFRAQKDIIKSKLFQQLRGQQKVRGKRPLVYKLNLSEELYNLESQANAFFEATEQSKAYDTETESVLLREHAIKGLPSSDNARIIALGCGSARKEFSFVLEYIKQKKANPMGMTFYATDSNQEMVNEALTNIELENIDHVQNREHAVHSIGRQIDFSNRESMRQLCHGNAGQRSIYLFLGSTIGNFEEEKQHLIMQNMTTSLSMKLLLLQHQHLQAW